MKYLAIYSVATILALSACQGNKNQDTNQADTSNTQESPITDSNANVQSTDSTLIVRENFERINGIKDWDKIDSAQIHESTEGGVATYFFKNNNLELIKVRNYGEGGYLLQDMYLKDNKLSFVYEQIYNYNTHIIDPKFDMKQTKKAGEARYYYFDDKLFNIIATDKENEKYLKEDTRTDSNMKRLFSQLIKVKDNGFNPKGISE